MKTNIKKGKKSLTKKVKIVDNKNKKLSVKEGTVKEVERAKNFLDGRPNVLKFSFLQNKALNDKPHISYIITMMFNNGTDKNFIITTPESTFDMDNKTFYLDFNESHFDLSLNQYRLYYHENCSTPIRRELEYKGENQYFTVKPDTLKDLIKFEYVKVLTGAHSIEDNIKKLMMFIIINMALTGVNLFLTYGLGK